jgi:hypothetical protein
VAAGAAGGGGDAGAQQASVGVVPPRRSTAATNPVPPSLRLRNAGAVAREHALKKSPETRDYEGKQTDDTRHQQKRRATGVHPQRVDEEHECHELKRKRGKPPWLPVVGDDALFEGCETIAVH